MTWQYVVLILGIWWGIIFRIAVVDWTHRHEDKKEKEYRPYDRGNPSI